MTSAEIRTRIDAAKARLAGLAEQRRPHALDAADGDSKARGHLDRLTRDAEKTEQEIVDLGLALEEAVAREAKDREAQLLAEADRQLASAKEISDRMVELYARIDEALAQIAATGADLDNEFKALARTGAVGSHQINRLRVAETFQRAVLAAGADRMFGVSRAIGRPASLASAAKTLLAVRRPTITAAA